jgi:spore maturation protein B
MEQFREIASLLAILVLPILFVAFPLYGIIRGVRVYEEFVVGAKEGFEVAVRIIPYLVAILFAIGMFRASGAMDAMMRGLSTPLAWIGVPPEILPMAIVRPLSGGASAGVLADLITRYGEESMVTRISAVIFGSTETTFYVIAVYFGAVNIRKTRHALPAGLIADFAAILLAVYVVQLFFA